MQYIFIERTVNEMSEYMQKDTSRKRMTSRDQQAAERREQLLQAAKELFAQQGFHATSTRSITKRVGMADGLIYHYFPGGKVEMLNLIVKEGHERRIASADEAFRALHNDDLPLRDALMMVARRMFVNLQADPELVMIQLREHAHLDPERSEYLKSSILQRQQWMAEFLERRAQRGEIRMMDFTLAARQFVSVSGFMVFHELLGVHIVEGDRVQHLERMVDFTVSMWLKHE